MSDIERIAGRRVVASISGGKDSAAMSLWLTEQGIEHDRVHLLTGWDADVTMEYIRGPLTRALGPIVEVRNDLLMVDLIRHKGTFPSKQRRWCTEELKVKPLRRWLDAQPEECINAVGIRAGESEARSRFAEWEWSDDLDCETWRPLLRWAVDDVIAIHRRHGLAPNPLYLRGAERVGCWPCIYERKAGVRLVADTDPGRINAVDDLETELTAKAGEQRAWFGAPLGRQGVWPIRRVVEWSRTLRGGRVEDKQVELFASHNPGCMRWGLCETAPVDESTEAA